MSCAPVVEAAPISSWGKLISDRKAVNRGLLVASVACSALALIPPVRMGGALALRAVGILASSNSCAERWAGSTKFDRALDISRIASIYLGGVGLVLATPPLVVASLVGDIAIQAFSVANELYQRGTTSPLPVGVIVIDALAAAAIFAGSWQLMVAAATVSAVFMVGVAIYASTQDDCNVIDVVSYCALAAIGLTAAFSIAKYTGIKKTDYRYEAKNPTDSDIQLIDAYGKEREVLSPGETFRVPKDVPFLKEPRHYTVVIPVHSSDGNGGTRVTYIPQDRIRQVNYLLGRRLDNGNTMRTYVDYTYTSVLVTYKEAINPELLPTVPVGGEPVQIRRRK